MDYGVATGERRTERGQVGQVAQVSVAGDALKVGEVAGLADEEAELSAFASKYAGHMMAYKSGGAREENLHG